MTEADKWLEGILQDIEERRQLRIKAQEAQAAWDAHHRDIAINARRAKYFVDHWEDEQLCAEVAAEVRKIRRLIEERMELRPEFQEELSTLHNEMGKKEFWENLAENMVGTEFEACGLRFKKFTYDSSLKPLWELEVSEPPPPEEPPYDTPASPPTFSYTLPVAPPPLPARPRRKWKWGFHPIGCLGTLVKLFFKLLLPAWLVLFAIHLWSPPAGDAPKPEPAKPKPTASVAAAKPVAGRPTAGRAQQVPTVGGKRFVVKQPLPIYRLDEEKHPVVAARVPAGSVVKVTGNLNAKVARVEVELPNGRKGKGLARLVDLQQLAESAE